MQFVEFELTTEFRDRFQQALDERDDNFIRETLENINPADITTLLYEFNSEESKYVLELLSVEVRSKIINDLDTDTRKKFLAVYQATEIAQIVNQLDSDDAADILNELPIKTSEEIISLLDPLLRSQVIDLLRYDA
ncbi:MAG: magnesium transporter MgtE N-terminal domain-containing protein, partial [Bacteroidota bacterium]